MQAPSHGVVCRAQGPHASLFTRGKPGLWSSRPGRPQASSSASRAAPFLQAGKAQRRARALQAVAAAAAHQERGAVGEEEEQQQGAAAAARTRPATQSSEFRAAGYLRAASFQNIPADRSEFARRAHLRMKGDYMWESLELQVARKDRQYRHVAVVPFVAIVSYTPGDAKAELLRADMADASCMLPAQDGQLPEIVVGTLDLNQGAKLPAEELIGREPAEGDRERLRAYLSNVCVAKAARRRGIAKALIRAAASEAARRGVRHLYVHVVADNEAARELYTQQCGFAVEQEESEATARALNRPRRLLLWRPLSEADAAGAAL